MSITFSPEEILASFRGFGRNPVQAEIDGLMRAGISAWSLAGAPGSGEHGIRFAQIDRLDDGRFDFSEGDGEPAMVVVARDQFGDVADIIAAKRDGYIAPWLGSVAMLGAHLVHGPRILDPHLKIFRDVIAWLRGDRDGVVMVDENRAAAQIHGFDPFCATAGVDHGLHLQRLFTPRMPKIVVPATLHERAPA